MTKKIIPAKEEHLTIFKKKIEILSNVVSKVKICRRIGILTPNIYQALQGKYDVTTYMSMNKILDEYAQELGVELKKVLKIKKF